MELTIENKTSVEKVKKAAFLMGGLLTYKMPAAWIKLVRWLQVGTKQGSYPADAAPLPCGWHADRDDRRVQDPRGGVCHA